MLWAMASNMPFVKDIIGRSEARSFHEFAVVAACVSPLASPLPLMSLDTTKAIVVAGGALLASRFPNPCMNPLAPASPLPKQRMLGCHEFSTDKVCLAVMCFLAT